MVRGEVVMQAGNTHVGYRDVKIMSSRQEAELLESILEESGIHAVVEAD